MDLRVQEEGNVSFIVGEGKMLAGQGDDTLKQELERLRGQGKKRIVVDFTNVPYIDSSILGQRNVERSPH